MKDALVRELAALLSLPSMPIEVDLAPSPSIVDGRFANNPWLQELPHPITKQTWGNAALMSATTAQKLGVGDEQVVSVSRGAAVVEVPALIVAGHAENRAGAVVHQHEIRDVNRQPPIGVQRMNDLE